MSLCAHLKTIRVSCNKSSHKTLIKSKSSRYLLLSRGARRPVSRILMGHNAFVKRCYFYDFTILRRAAEKRFAFCSMKSACVRAAERCTLQQSRIWCHKSLRLAFIDHSSNIEQISFIGPCKSPLNEVSNVTHTCQIFINHIFLQTSYTLRYNHFITHHPKTYIRVIYHPFCFRLLSLLLNGI